MKSPQRVVWSEGLLMSPQHLQQLDLYHEGLLATRMDALDPLSWGALSVKIDRRALSTGQLQLQELLGVLPDGTYLSVAQGDPELPPSRPVEGHFPHTQTTLEVFIGLPKERDGISNYARDGATHRVRFTVAAKSVPDLTGGADPINVSFAQRNATILFGDEPRDDFEAMKIAEVVRDDAGSLVVSDPYIPPCLRISASPFMVEGLRRLLRLMVTRHRSLSEARRQRGESTIEFNASDVTRFLLLNAVNTFLPVMSYMVDAQDISPRNAYLLLCQLAGQLATFSPTFDPSTLPKFVYTDLRGTFEELFARITALLQSTVKEHHIALPLEARADGMHIGQFQNDALFTAEQYFISVQAGLSEQEITNQLPRLSKIASWGDINGILSAATPGAPVEVTFRPPPEIPIKAGLVYFSINTDNAYWRNVMSERKVAIYLPRPFDPTSTSITLLAIPSRQSAG